MSVDVTGRSLREVPTPNAASDPPGPPCVAAETLLPQQTLAAPRAAEGRGETP